MSRPVIQYRRATPADFDGILRLQHQNLKTTLGDKNLSQGFLTVEFTREQLYRINSDIGIFVAVLEGKTIGYLMAESVDFAAGSPLIAHMVARLKEFIFDGVPLMSCRVFVYGPVCIDERHRGQRILDALFCAMLESLHGRYDAGVAFVSMLNARSFNAHTNKLRMRIADEFEFSGQKYWTLVFAVKRHEGTLGTA